MPLKLSEKRAKIRAALQPLKVGETMPFRLTSKLDRLCAYYLAEKLGIEIVARQHPLAKKEFEVTRIK